MFFFKKICILVSRKFLFHEGFFFMNFVVFHGIFIFHEIVIAWMKAELLFKNIHLH